MIPARAARSVWKRTTRLVRGLSPLEEVRARRDKSSLLERFPVFEELARRRPAIVRALRDPYVTYVGEVSTPIMAVSLKSAALLHFLCEVLEPGRVLDLGSGFSSLVFRSWNPPSGRRALVLSVDDDLSWLNRTRAFLDAQGVAAEGLLDWDRYLRNESGRRFDLVFHDVGSLAFRTEHLGVAIDAVDDGGVLILDDMHKPDLRGRALPMLAEAGLHAFSLRKYTLDRFWRYAYLACR